MGTFTAARMPPFVAWGLQMEALGVPSATWNPKIAIPH